jgi:RNA polymerase sigma factor (sigma-70 family)
MLSVRRGAARARVLSAATSTVAVDPATPRPGEGALTAIWPHVAELRGYLRKRLPASEVDDVVQDVFVRLVHRGEGSEVRHPRRYLYQVALATLVDRHRHETSRCSRLHCDLLDAELPGDELSPDRFLLARESVRSAQRVLGELPDRTRGILIAVRVEGASLKTVADRHGISVSAVEKHLVRALRALREDRAQRR